MWNSHLIAQAAKDILEDYLPGYIGVIERRHGLADHLPVPDSYVSAPQDDTGTPGLGNTRVFALCPGTTADPEEMPEGGFYGAYALVVVIGVMKRKNRETVDSQLGFYQEAIRECITREGSKVFGNIVIDWEGENSDLGDPDMALTQGAGESLFTIYLPDLLTGTNTLFPDGPPEDPYEPLPGDPVIDEIDYEVINHPVDEEL